MFCDQARFTNWITFNSVVVCFPQNDNVLELMYLRMKIYSHVPPDFFAGSGVGSGEGASTFFGLVIFWTRILLNKVEASVLTYDNNQPLNLLNTSFDGFGFDPAWTLAMILPEFADDFFFFWALAFCAGFFFGSGCMKSSGGTEAPLHQPLLSPSTPHSSGLYCSPP